MTINDNDTIVRWIKHMAKPTSNQQSTTFFTHIIMSHNMIILYFCLPYFHVSITAFLHSTLVTLFYI